MNWWDALTRKWWPADEQVQPTPEVRDWLQSKHDVAMRLAPQSIGEIGVRAGYSAFAMLSAAQDATYIGVDVGDSERYGSEPGALAHGVMLLKHFRAFVIVADSHDLGRLPPFDLLHIDGDHSAEGCRSDLELAARSGVRWALIDDYHTGDVVGPVVDAFARERGIIVESIDDGFRGSALLELTR